MWLHYLVLLYVPIALARPRLSGLWLLPLALWPFMWIGWFGDWPAGNLEELLIVAGLTVTVVTVAMIRGPSRSRRSAPARLDRIPSGAVPDLQLIPDRSSPCA